MSLIFFILFTVSNLSSFPSRSIFPGQDTFTSELYRADSLNMKIIGMWNFGSPLAIYTSNDYLYLGSGGSVIIFDVSDTTNPQKIGHISFPGRYVRGIYVLDTLMFVGDGEKGFRIAKISNPVYPEEIGSYESYFSTAVFVKNNLAYVLELSTDSVTIGELVIYDVSDPQEPNILGEDALPEPHIADIIVKDKYAYVANGQGGLRIIDVSDSKNPFEISYYIPPANAYVRSISICCDTLLLLGVDGLSHNGGLWVINITDPYNPCSLGCDTSFSEGCDVSYYSHFSYVSTVSEGIKIIDFIDPSNPYVIGEFLPPSYLWNAVNTNIGPYVYAGEWRSNGLRTIDVSDSTQPVTIDYDLIPDQSMDVSVQGNYAYIANLASGIYILDISEPSNPNEISHYDTPGLSCSIIVKDSIAYIADSSSIILLNIKDPFYPEKISELSLVCDGHGLALNFPYLYVTSTKNHQFVIVDVNNAQNPVITDSCYLDSALPTSICYKDSLAFVSAPWKGMAVINTADVYNPILITYLTLLGYPVGIAYTENYLYAADFETNFINIINISDPTNPFLEDLFYTIRDYPFALSISDSFLYVSLQGYGIEVLNISSPLLPQSIGHYCGAPLGIPRGITFANGLAYLTADNGIFIFEYTGGAGEKEEASRSSSKANISFKCYPSTFSKKVSIEINTEKKESIKLQIYDIAGRKIKDIFTGRIKGKKLFFWHGLNNKGREVSSGIYFLGIESRIGNYHKKLVFIGK